jgi:hypothetical protein
MCVFVAGSAAYVATTASAGVRKSCAPFTAHTPGYSVRVFGLGTYAVSCVTARKIVRGFYADAPGGSASRIVLGLKCAGQGNDRIRCIRRKQVVRWTQRVS